MMKQLSGLFLGLAALCLSLPVMAAPLKVACVGDSITYGFKIANRETNSYPAQLQKELDKRGKGKFEVRNFGVSSMTLMQNTKKPYVKRQEYKDSLAFTPDIVVIMLGTNDSSGANRALIADNFMADYGKLIASYREGREPGTPRIILMLPPKCYLTGKGTDEDTIRKTIAPMIRKVAKDEKVELLDLHASIGTRWKQDLMPDKLHPSAKGAAMMVKKIAPLVAKGVKKAPASAGRKVEFGSGSGTTTGGMERGGFQPPLKALKIKRR